MSNFYIGQKVVCVNDEAGWNTGEKLLIKGQIYTVRQMDYTDLFIDDQVKSWDKSRFRPLQEISDFTYNEAIEMVSQTVEV